MLHVQLRLQAGGVGNYTSAWRAELLQESKNFLSLEAASIQRAANYLVLRTEEVRVPACKVAQLVAA